MHGQLPRIVPTDALQGPFRQDLNALCHRDLQQAIANLLVVSAQNLVGAIHERHLHTELVEDSGKLVCDIAGAHDHDAPRKRVEMERVVRGDAELRAGNLRNVRTGSRGDQDDSRAELAFADAHCIGPQDDCTPLQDLHVVIRQRLRIQAAEALDLVQHIVPQCPPVELRATDLPTEAPGILQILGEVRAIHEQLLRYTTANHTRTAHAVLFDDGHLRAVSRGNARGPDTAGTGSKNDEVVVKCRGHGMDTVAKWRSSVESRGPV